MIRRGALVLAVLAISVLSLASGDYPLSLGEVFGALTGTGDAQFIVTEFRLPRLLAGLLVGAALAAGGAITQSLSGNPLGSPDMIGFTEGAATGALLLIVLTDAGTAETSAGALAGGFLTAVAIYLLTYRRGVQGVRLVLVGLGVSAMLIAVNSYLITRASLRDAAAAQSWLVGGLNGLGWEHVGPVAAAVAVLLPLGLVHGRRMALMEMGDDAATGLGVPVERTRLVLLTVSVGLTAFATAIAGPIAFVALAAPQLAKRVVGSLRVGASALVGALLLVTCDFLTQRLFPAASLPVGIATGLVGGLYLLWLLIGAWRRKRA
ncbi:iron complex transport system permease protein [Amycolatopsis xylanica]|uniref:Iron complex transport system permease protein n=1 Tax=Amycolatopsis xylanica TaxID=589385 RepID=A0A1H3P6R5_9PSEU|nr:iron chelate uptake ABC transporter family permease subunit [Amycolatopsis xylanica]SDY96740.1 iron complex transport system permease protein [Amycolatopsis xylanica]